VLKKDQEDLYKLCCPFEPTAKERERKLRKLRKRLKIVEVTNPGPE